jgi:hypothetical protein
MIKWYNQWVRKNTEDVSIFVNFAKMVAFI